MFGSFALLFRSPALADLDRRSLFTVGVASLVINLLLFALPLYSLQVYDRVLTSRSVDTLWLLTLIVVVALGLTALVDTLRARMLLRVGNAFVLDLGPRLLDAAIAHSARSSEANGQPLRDLQTVRSFVTGPQGLVTLFDAPLVPIFLLAVYAMHFGLGNTMLIGMLLLLGVTLLTERLTARSVEAAGEAGIRAQGRIDSVMQNAEVVEALGMRAAMRDYWQSAQADALRLGSKAADRAAHLAGLAKAVRLLLNLLLAGVAAWYAIHDQITTGVMVAAGILAARGLAPLEAMTGAWKGLVSTRAAVGRINVALDRFRRAESGMSLPAPAGRLSVERLIYAPPGAEQATLKGISFTLEPGSWLGLIGPSAAGKSTLAKLICGVWQPRSGCVRLDGADVFTWNRTQFGEHCGYLPQDVELFAGSIRDNIARFTAADDEQVVAAAQMAGCHEMILRLPNGYDTQIGAGGSTLSGGQRQRVGLARALFRQPRLIVLDEPNASLDSEGEAALLLAIGRAREAGSTIIMVSHRPSALAGADQLAVLADGQLQHFGPRDEVLAKVQQAFTRPLREVKRAGLGL
jgi:PrtD family type I secretion system ABC transporter